MGQIGRLLECFQGKLAPGFLAGILLGAALVLITLLGRWIAGRAAEDAEEETELPKPAQQPGRPTDPLACFMLRDLAKSYRERAGGQVKVFSGLNLDIPLGGMVGILGPSGCGKSTLLNLLAGIDKPDGGLLAITSSRPGYFELVTWNSAHTRRVAFIFQDLNLISHLSALENAALPLLCAGAPRRPALERARHYLEQLQIDAPAMRRRPDQLSGGQRQRVAIARALTQGAEIILADELTGSLDAENAEAIMAELARLVQERVVSVIMVTHNETLAEKYCTKLVRLGNETLRLFRAPGKGTEPGSNHEESGVAGEDEEAEEAEEAEEDAAEEGEEAPRAPVKPRAAGWGAAAARDQSPLAGKD